MHVAASNPQFLSASEVSEEAIAKEKEIFLALNADKIAGKPENIVENMVKGRISKFLAEASLVEQPFVKNPEVKVGDLASRPAPKSFPSFVTKWAKASRRPKWTSLPKLPLGSRHQA